IECAEYLGAKTYFNTKVEKIEQLEQGIRIKTDKDSYVVEKVIIASGPWIGELLPEFNDFVEVRRLIGTWFQPKNTNLFTKEHFPVFTRKSDNTSFYGFPTIDDQFVKISLTSNK